MSVPKRQQIREALKTLLTGNTAAGSSVYSNRMSALWREELPSISIYMTEETSTPKNLSQSSYIRTGTLIVQILAEAKEDLDDVLDAIADEVEAVIDANKSLSGTVQGCTLQSTELELNKEAQIPVGSCGLVYQISYIK